MSRQEDYRAIQNTLSTYCFALDDKNFELLNEVFTPDVIANYPFNEEPILGVERLRERIRGRLSPVTTQHALTTQHIRITSFTTPATSPKTAKATTYFTGVHLGRGKWAGEQVVAYGKYVDELVFVAPGSGDGGSGRVGDGVGQGAYGDGVGEREGGVEGKWLISKRTVTFFGRVGEEGVMAGET